MASKFISVIPSLRLLRYSSLAQGTEGARQSAPAAPRRSLGGLARWALATLLLLDFCPASWADDSGDHDHGGGSGNPSNSGPGFTPYRPTRGAFEVWLSDQANTVGFSLQAPNGTHGGKLRIYDSADLLRPQPINNPLVLDASIDLFPNALEKTNSHVTRLHGIKIGRAHV